MNKILRNIIKTSFKINPKLMLKLVYLYQMKSILNLKHPQLLSEKVNYLILNGDNQKRGDLADKYKMHSYIKSLGYTDVLVDLLGVYNNPEEINFESLPNKFVLKCNHGCKYNVICTDKSKLDKEEVKKKLNEWLNEKYGYVGGELHYNYIEPKIICERFIEGLSPTAYPIDYKLHCINGKVEFILCCTEREERVKFIAYDATWNKIQCVEERFNYTGEIQKPKNFDYMCEIAEKISKEFPVLRIDFYESNNKVYLGEITVTPAAGRFVYFKREFDKQIGDKCKLER